VLAWLFIENVPAAHNVQGGWPSTIISAMFKYATFPTMYRYLPVPLQDAQRGLRYPVSSAVPWKHKVLGGDTLGYGVLADVPVVLSDPTNVLPMYIFMLSFRAHIVNVLKRSNIKTESTNVVCEIKSNATKALATASVWKKLFNEKSNALDAW
jgi:hypothetical protein